MRKYHWKDAKLKKKSQIYDWLMLILGGLTLIIWYTKGSSLLMLVCLAGAVVCFVLSWKTRNSDKVNKKIKETK